MGDAPTIQGMAFARARNARVASRNKIAASRYPRRKDWCYVFARRCAVHPKPRSLRRERRDRPVRCRDNRAIGCKHFPPMFDNFHW